MAEKDKRYYWLKLKRDFFKRHDIRIIEDMPNGKDYILFYLKLLCESVDHEGHLRFSDEIPYNDSMLATITNTNIDIVRSAVKVFTDLKMMDFMDDGTFYMREVEKMVGSETYWAQKQRERRAKLDNVQLLSNESQTCPSKSKSIEKELEKEKECVAETLTHLKDLMQNYSFSYELRQAVSNWVLYKIDRNEEPGKKMLESILQQIHEHSIRVGDGPAAELITTCIGSGYKSIVFDRLKKLPLTPEAIELGLNPL